MELHDIEITLTSVNAASAMEAYCEEHNLSTYTEERDNKFILHIFSVTEGQLQNLRRRCAIESGVDRIVHIIDRGREILTGTINIAGYRVATPLMHAGIKAAAETGKVAAKVLFSTAASACGSTAENTRKAATELKKDREVQHAITEIKIAGRAITRFFNLTGGSNVRIVEKQD